MVRRLKKDPREIEGTGSALQLVPERVAPRRDTAARELGTTRSAFAREALRAALARLRTRELEARHREGYRRKPVKPGEFDAWLDDQVWPEP